jgi:hypothetical protein
MAKIAAAISSGLPNLFKGRHSSSLRLSFSGSLDLFKVSST